MIFKSEHITQASGSIAGVTYARSKGGTLYRRARAIPVNPQSTYQTQVRDALTSAVNQWVGLTQAQRDAWDVYGQNVPVTNKLGSTVTLSGQNWFNAWMTAQLQALSKLGVTAFGTVAAPTVYDRGDFTTPTIASVSATTGASLVFDANDEWNASASGNLYIYVGRSRNPSRNFFKGPYRLLDYVDGVVGGGTSPQAISAATFTANGWPLVAGQRIQFQAAVIWVDGRITTRRTFGDVIIGA